MKQESRYPHARALLEKVRKAERKVELLRQRVANLRMLTTNTTVCLTGMPRSGSPDQQRLATLLAEIDEKERELLEAELEALWNRTDAVREISLITNPKTQMVLLALYFDRQTLREVARSMGYSRSHIFRMQQAGLAEMEKRYKAEQSGTAWDLDETDSPVL